MSCGLVVLAARYEVCGCCRHGEASGTGRGAASTEERGGAQVTAGRSAQPSQSDFGRRARPCRSHFGRRARPGRSDFGRFLDTPLFVGRVFSISKVENGEMSPHNGGGPQSHPTMPQQSGQAATSSHNRQQPPTTGSDLYQAAATSTKRQQKARSRMGAGLPESLEPATGIEPATV